MRTLPESDGDSTKKNQETSGSVDKSFSIPYYFFYPKTLEQAKQLFLNASVFEADNQTMITTDTILERHIDYSVIDKQVENALYYYAESRDQCNEVISEPYYKPD